METQPVHCPSCEREVDDSLTWCPYCGTELPRADASQSSPGEEEQPEAPFAAPTPDTPEVEYFTADPEPSSTATGTGDPFLDDTPSLPGDVIRRAPGRRSAASVAVVAGLLLVLGIGAAAFFAFAGGDDPEETSGDVSVHSMRVGICWNDPAGVGFGALEVLEVDAVPCGEPHDNEVYALAEYPASGDAAYPGDAAIQEAAFDLCRAAFEPFTGVPYEMSLLDIFYIFPTLETWIEGDREIVCSLYRIDTAPMTGSQSGVGLALEGEFVDVGQAADCTGLASLTVDVVAETVAVFDSLDSDEAAALDELPAELLPAVKNEVLLVNRASELGCDLNLLNDLVSAGAGRLTATTELGQMVLDGIMTEGFFVP
jgi:hypothetical protein